MERMDGRTDQQMVGVCPADPKNCVGGQDAERWCENKHIQATAQHQQLSCYKFHEEVAQNGIADMPLAAQWWREGLGNFANSVSVPREDQLSGKLPTRPSYSPGCGLESYEEPRVSLETSNSGQRGAVRRKTSRDHRETTKRTKQPETWKVNMKKNARLRGEEYVGVGGKIVKAKVMGRPCNCRMRCSEKIDEESREELHNVFWKICNWEQRRQYIALLVKESATQRTRCRKSTKSEHRRQVTFTYSLLMNGDPMTVCKPMFLSTFSVSEKLVRLAMDKKRTSPGGIIGADQRGRHTPKTKKAEAVKDLVREHIKSFPAEANPADRSGRKYLDASLSIAAMHKFYVNKCRETGVPEADIVKESYYREMFKSEFNLGFKTLDEKTKIAHLAGHEGKPGVSLMKCPSTADGVRYSFTNAARNSE